MTVRVFLTPIILTGSPRPGRRPKYFDGFIAAYSMMDYGLEPVALVVADVTNAEVTSLTANADLSILPAALDTILTSGAVTTIQNTLEALLIPAGWVNTTMTYRQVLRVVAQIFQFAQRLAAMGATRLFPTGVTLSTQFQNLPAAYAQALLDAANSFGWNTSGLSGTNTMRQILKALADQWGNSVITIGGIDF